MESGVQKIGRREWWLWFSALAVTTLSGIAFLLSSFHSLFLHSDHFFEIRSDQARWGTLSLLLLFDAWLVYRQWSFRHLRRELTKLAGDSQTSLGDVYDPSRMDSVTGLYTRASIEHALGKEVARARRHNVPLSLVAIHLDDHLRKASRGSDFVARLGSDEFLLVLPECSLGGAKIAVDRLGTLNIKCSGQDIALTYSAGWIDYKRGEVPADLLKRAQELLQLYKKASNDARPSELLLR
jgi:GGDEF domain-containing protein